VRPVLGNALCDALLRGEHPDFLAGYILPPLALYVKALMLPALAVQAGAAGVAEVNSKNMARVGDAKLRASVRRLRGDALALMRRAVDHLESASPGSYPSYDPAANVLNRCSVEGGDSSFEVESGKLKNGTLEIFVGRGGGSCGSFGPG
jgi:hypothetical protein